MSLRGRYEAYRPFRVFRRKQNRNCRSGSSSRLGRCRGHEAITGGYGIAGVQGVVTMAVGMSKKSPTGVGCG